MRNPLVYVFDRVFFKRAPRFFKDKSLVYLLKIRYPNHYFFNCICFTFLCTFLAMLVYRITNNLLLVECIVTFIAIFVLIAIIVPISKYIRLKDKFNAEIPYITDIIALTLLTTGDIYSLFEVFKESGFMFEHEYITQSIADINKGTPLNNIFKLLSKRLSNTIFEDIFKLLLYHGEQSDKLIKIYPSIIREYYVSDYKVRTRRLEDKFTILIVYSSFSPLFLVFIFISMQVSLISFIVIAILFTIIFEIIKALTVEAEPYECRL